MSLPSPSPKQTKLIWAALTALALAVLLVLIVACIWGLGQLLHIFSAVVWPLAVAGVLAYLLDPVVDFLAKRHVPRTRAIIVVFGAVLVILLGLIGSILPSFISQTRDLVERIPEYGTNVQARIEGWVNNPPKPLLKAFDKFVLRSTNAPSGPVVLVVTNNETGVVSTNTGAVAPAPGTSSSRWSQVAGTDAFKSVADWLTRAVPKIGSWIVNRFSGVATFFGLLLGLTLVPVYTFYFLLEKRSIESNWTDYLPVKKSELKDEVVFIINAINDHLIAFFRGQVLVAFCDGICYTIGFLLVGLRYSVLLGVMATFLTMIPFLGAIVTCATALVIAFVQFGDWKHPLLVLAVFGVVQSLEGFVIQPKIMGDRVGLHPLTIIIAVMAGTTLLGGILGGILAIPLTAAGKVLMLRYVWRKREA